MFYRSSMRTRLRGSISGLLTKSQSVINLRRSSSSISGGSSLYKNYDSALDSASLKSDASGSSDQLSSLSSAAGSNLTSPQDCQSDPASDAVCLRHESPRDQPSNHYHKLSAQVSSLSSSRDFRTKVRKSQSCEVLTTSDIHDREDNSKS
ncbi:hypothetical protein EB796_015715 [Bugula neritina]|uniref:Uncharacterized protein n=1 Tax=Bugula neritina TaxID=10212 RepID=A0A7J7JKK6_BUGNE|nr:hypothetical protein EB796_015715 [Bugula neritina]